MMSALSIYLVMQQMEAVIFRLLILSVPIWLVWRNAMRKENAFVPEPEVYQIIDCVSYSRSEP
jgi:ABC-type nickel/cobalt efflux system permease component RcnA